MNTSEPDFRTPDKTSEKKDNSRLRAIVPVLPVIIVFVALTVVAWLIPLRPTMSESENRNLEKFPQLTVEALLDGSYFDDIGVWFSDTFTFRESWINTAKGLESLYGSRTVAIYGEIGAVDDIPEINVSVPDTGEAPSAPADEAEPVETNAPDQQDTDESGSAGQEQSEEPTGEGSDDSDTEKESYDPRNEGGVEAPPDDATQSSWGGQLVDEEDYVGYSAVIQIENATYNYTGFSQTYADMYTASMNKAAGLLDGKARLFTVLALENTTFMLTREDRLAMSCKPEEDAVEYIFSNLDSRIQTVSVYDNLIKHNSEYLAFRTDPHWTATAAYYAYESWCEVAGVEPVPLSEYEVIEYPGFYGSNYGKAARANLIEEDTVVCYVPPGNITLYLSDNSDDGLGWEQPLITDRTNAPDHAKYLAFLAGDHAKGTFINDDITDGSACLVIKTSVGNPFVYYLTQHYQYVYVLDIRYYFGRSLTSFVDHFEIDDVIFMHGTGFAMGSGGNSVITNFVR